MSLKRRNTPDTRVAITILSGAALSDEIRIGNFTPRGLAVQVPVAWTAADIGFEVSADGISWVPLYDAFGARVKIAGIATAEIRFYATPPEAWASGAYQRLRLASLHTSTGAALNQGADRSLVVAILL